MNVSARAALSALLALAIAGPATRGAAGAPPADPAPRKVLVGTVNSGAEAYSSPLAERFGLMEEWVGRISAEAARAYPGKPVDLVVLPEAFLANPGGTMARRSVRLGEVLPRVSACARRHRCYLVVGIDLDESGRTARYTNVAALVGRDGRLVGMYRKVHLPVPQGSDVLEDGTTPGADYPVFDCDFGRVGLQVCFDLLYPEGWEALARKGAEIVALPSASSEVAHPRMYALQHGYYLVTSAPRNHSAVYNPLGLAEADATRAGEVAVDEFDLSFRILHWDASLDGGELLRRRFGDRVGFRYYVSEDAGVFWSNDPATPIDRMLAEVGFLERDAYLRRAQALADRARGGPPEAP